MFWFRSQVKKSGGKESRTSGEMPRIITTRSHKPFHQNPDHPWQYYKNVARRELDELLDRADSLKAPCSTDSVHTCETMSSLSLSLEEELARLRHTQAGDETSSEFSSNSSETYSHVLESITRVPFSPLDGEVCVARERLCDYPSDHVHSLLSLRGSAFKRGVYSPTSDSGLTPTPHNSPRGNED